MLEKLQSLDTKLFIFLNGLGSITYDGFWLIITKQIYWAPLFLILLYSILKKIGIKQSIILILFVAVLILFTDQMTNVIKNGFQRLRPCSNPDINSIIRVVKSRTSFGFFSGHAATSMAVATFLYQILKDKIKYFMLLFFWPLIFAYSRIYLGLHYPGDIVCGFLFGAVSGFTMFKIYESLQNKYFNIE